jgi:hypothetical protein
VAAAAAAVVAAAAAVVVAAVVVAAAAAAVAAAAAAEVVSVAVLAALVVFLVAAASVSVVAALRAVGTADAVPVAAAAAAAAASASVPLMLLLPADASACAAAVATAYAPHHGVLPFSLARQLARGTASRRRAQGPPPNTAGPLSPPVYLPRALTPAPAAGFPLFALRGHEVTSRLLSRHRSDLACFSRYLTVEAPPVLAFIPTRPPHSYPLIPLRSGVDCMIAISEGPHSATSYTSATSLPLQGNRS